MAREMSSLIVVAVVFLLSTASAFYLPGVSPTNHEDEAMVVLKQNSFTSAKTHLPYTIYDGFAVCQPHERDPKNENFGELLLGDRIFASSYDLKMNRNSYCNILCVVDEARKDFDKQCDRLAELIRDDYRGNMIIDNLPAGTKRVLEYVMEDGEVQPRDVWERGYPLGFVGTHNMQGAEEGAAYVNNHLTFVVSYHSDPEKFVGSRIVGFEVRAHSVKHTSADSRARSDPELKLLTCHKDAPFPGREAVDAGPQPARGEGLSEIIYTYDVEWVESPIEWASRWDHYLEEPDMSIHWFSIMNSVMIALFLTGMVALIIVRVLRKDFQRYEEDTSEELQEETGWKLVHGDVFRPPNRNLALSVAVGTGAQVFGMTCVTMVFAVLGFLSPAFRGGLLSALMFLYIIMGIVAGYFSARLYKLFKGLSWKRCTLLTATVFPGLCFAVFLFLNLIISGQESAGAAPIHILFGMLLLWFGVSTPLVFIGAYFGYKAAPIEFPCRTNQIPRQVPEQPWYMSPKLSIFVGGILPFGAVFIELFFILSALWLNQVYYVFGFLFLVLIILVVTCAEITIVMCYFQLCSEDYHWWWRSFFTPASSGLYLFLYSIVYFSSNLQISQFESTLIYFGYMFLASVAFGLITGYIGFVSCLVFVLKIYGSIKID